MDNSPFEKTQAYLFQLLRYLESMHSSSNWENENLEKSTRDISPSPRIAAILSHSGSLEGMRLKAQGCLSSEIVDFIRTVGMAFEIEAQPREPFKLPYIHSEIRIQRKTLNAFMEKAWLIYHAALLSAYSLRPLGFERHATLNEMEVGFGIVEAETDTSPENENAINANTLHSLNNVLAGILGYINLLQEERKSDTELMEKLEKVAEATLRASSLLPTNSMNDGNH